MLPNLRAKLSLASVCILALSASSAFSTDGHLYIATSASASFARMGISTPQITYPAGVNITDAYPLKNNPAASPLLSVNGGYEFMGNKGRPAIALGLGIYDNLADYDFKGQLIETATGDPSSLLYNYKYNLNTVRVMAEVQLTWNLGRLSPFINAGVGPAWNRLYSYNETPATSNGFVALPAFQSRTNASLAYQAGFGVSTAFNYKGNSGFLSERVGLGYRYARLGNTSLGTRGSAYPYKLNTGRLTTNDLYLSYTHLF